MCRPPKPSDAPLREGRGSCIVRVFSRRASCAGLLGAQEDGIEAPRDRIVRLSSLIDHQASYLQKATEERDVIGPFLQCGVEQ